MEKIPKNEVPDIAYYAFTAREHTAEQFKDKNKDVLEETLSDLNRLYALKIACISYGSDFSKSPKFDAFSIFIKALEILVSALHLATHRQIIEAFALIRLSLESGATAFHIVVCEEAFALYCKGSYKSTHSITHAKEVVPIIGQLWGALSNIAVHINSRAHGPFYQPSDDNEGTIGTIEFPLAGRSEKLGQDLSVLTAISLVSNIILRLFEESLLEKSNQYKGWLQFPGTLHSYTCPTDKIIGQLYDKFIKIPDAFES